MDESLNMIVDMNSAGPPQTARRSVEKLAHVRMKEIVPVLLLHEASCSTGDLRTVHEDVDQVVSVARKGEVYMDPYFEVVMGFQVIVQFD